MALAAEQELQVRALIVRTILKVLRTPGGGLWTVKYGKQKPDEQAEQFTSLAAYEDWCVAQVAEWATKKYDDSEEGNDKYALMSLLFPMLESDKDDGGVSSEVGDELYELVHGSVTD
jgi:hypothetical protein